MLDVELEVGSEQAAKETGEKKSSEAPPKPASIKPPAEATAGNGAS